MVSRLFDLQFQLLLNEGTNLALLRELLALQQNLKAGIDVCQN